MERDAFLDKIAARLGRSREALPSPRGPSTPPDDYLAHPFGASDIVESEWPEKFKTELEAIAGTVTIVDSADAASQALRATLSALHVGSSDRAICTWGRSEFAGWQVEWLWDEVQAVEFVGCDSRADSNAKTEDVAGESLGERTTHSLIAMSDAHVGITTADLGIVNTGTLLLRTSAAKNRSVSLLAYHHVALLRESQLVARLGDALSTFTDVDPTEMPSSVHFISGPSRSGDIENDLTIGVHGPASVTVILWRDISSSPSLGGTG